MSKQRSGVTLTASSVVGQKKYCRNMELQARGIFSSVDHETMVLPCGSKLGKNETNDADTLIIHDTAVCLRFRLDRLLYAETGEVHNRVLLSQIKLPSPA